jgi:hypothetical protein
MNLTTLRALQSRIRECKGADRELDCSIACALLGGEPHRLYPSGFGNDWRRNVGRAYFNVDPYTTYPDGLGACVSLLNQVLPGWTVELRLGASGNYARIHEFDPPCRRLPENGMFHLANDCLTFIDAIVSAKISELETQERAA